MRVRLLMVAIAGLSLSATALADPAKAPVSKAGQPADQAAPVLVASADEVIAPVTNDRQPKAADPAKPVRHARVTTCRCGDQTNPGSN